MSGKEAKAVVPKLRFPEFREAGAWEEKEVGEIFKVTRGEVLSMRLVSDMPSETTPYPVYSSQTKNNGLSGYYSDFLYENAITWTTDGANAGDVNYRPGKFYCTNVCGVLINNDGYANVFIAELLNTITRKHVSYIGNPKLMNGVMAKIKIILPPLPEQQKIAHCLSSLDEVIGLQAKQVQALKQHKKGLMQQLVPAEGETTPRLRFPEFREAGAWEIKRLGKVLDITGGGTPSRKNPDFWKGDIPWVSSSDISADSIKEISIKKFITPEAIKKSATKLIPKNSILLVSRVGVGKLAITRKPICTSQDFTNLTHHQYNVLFLAYYLRSISHVFESFNQGMAIKGFTKENVESLSLALPDVKSDEQQKIAHCLSSLDEVIGLEAHKLDALKNLKKGLMQQLFPQEVA